MSITEIVMENIRKVLKERKMRQSDLASAIDVSDVYFSDLLAGRKGKGFKVDMLEKIANALECPIETLFKSDIVVPKTFIDQELEHYRKRLSAIWSSAPDRDRGFIAGRLDQFFIEYEELTEKRNTNTSKDVQAS